MRALRIGMAAAPFAVLCATLLAPGVEPSASAGPTSAGATSFESIRTAQRQFDAGSYTEAIATLQTTVAQDSSNDEVYYWLGRSYYELGDYDSAITQLAKAAGLDAKSSLYHQWLGRAYGGKADRDRSFFLARKVKKEFQIAVSLDPSNVSARRDLEEYCLDAPWIVGGSKDDALQQVNAIAGIDPVEGHLARAVYYREATKKLDQAENEYRRVLAAKPNRVEPYFEAAEFFQGQGRASDMEAAIQAAAQVKPNDERLAFYRGVVGVMTDSNLAGAEQDLKSYLATAPNRSDWPSHSAGREWLGRLYETEGKPAEAAEQYRSALRLDPKNREARTRLERLAKTP